MATEIGFESTGYLTQEGFGEWVLERQGRDPNRYELLNGRIVMNPPAGFPHALIEAAVVQALRNFVAPRSLGLVMGSSAGFELPTGDTVEPDATFISQARWDAAPPPEMGKFSRVVPDLAVEILSRPTASRDRGEKKGLYERNGVAEYWIVDPLARTIRVFHLADGRFDTGSLCDAEDLLDSRVLAGLQALIADFFPY